jgi:hypothetical protein
MKHCSLRFALILMLVGLLISSLQALPQSSVPSPGVYSTGPITDYAAAAPKSSDVLRFRRGERYNSPNSPLPELGEESDASLVVEDTGKYWRDPMPFSQSDAVVVGTIKDGQAYLSNDKRDIYSEFGTTIQEVIKTPTAPYLRLDDTITIERQGGTVRLPSGKVLIRAWKDNSMPLVGKRYLLFLRYSPSTEDYRLLTGYQLEHSVVYSLDDLEQKDRNRDTLVHVLRERGENESQFLEQVRTSKPPVKGGN